MCWIIEWSSTEYEIVTKFKQGRFMNWLGLGVLQIPHIQIKFISSLTTRSQPFHLGGLGDDHRVPLEPPPEHKLGWRLAVLLSKRLHRYGKQVEKLSPGLHNVRCWNVMLCKSWSNGMMLYWAFGVTTLMTGSSRHEMEPNHSVLAVEPPRGVCAVTQIPCFWQNLTRESRWK